MGKEIIKKRKKQILEKLEKLRCGGIIELTKADLKIAKTLTQKELNYLNDKPFLTPSNPKSK